MNVQYVNSFFAASRNVLETVLNVRPTRGAVRVQPATFASHQCNMVYGVTGQAQGQVIYGMSQMTALNVASTMLGQTLDELGTLGTSAIGELGNMISGNAMQHMSEAGLVCDITPPTIIQGGQVQINMISTLSIVIPLTLSEGEFFITVGLQDRAQK